MPNSIPKDEFAALSGHLSGVPSDPEVDSEATISDIKGLIDSMLDDKDEATSNIKADADEKDLVAVPITTSEDIKIGGEKEFASPPLAAVPLNMVDFGEKEVPLPKWLVDHPSYKEGWKSVVRVRQSGSSRGNKDRVCGSSGISISCISYLFI
ncbi:uncharacterized protein LOC109725383 [Ananas comosus]|uniref:Uncharacterized protein LOC109725383 n=1 Tax=Ananas comosus TaxID=4615 RepID=A0A6P5GQQ5_ANACO|nr:uncharacterized protein LOC109725383 [Ananas comosus]